MGIAVENTRRRSVGVVEMDYSDSLVRERFPGTERQRFLTGAALIIHRLRETLHWEVQDGTSSSTPATRALTHARGMRVATMRGR